METGVRLSRGHFLVLMATAAVVELLTGDGAPFVHANFDDYEEVHTNRRRCSFTLRCDEGATEGLRKLRKELDGRDSICLALVDAWFEVSCELAKREEQWVPTFVCLREKRTDWRYEAEITTNKVAFRVLDMHGKYVRAFEYELPPSLKCVLVR